MAKYDVTVKLTGTDGNVFALIGKVVAGLRAAKVSHEERDAFVKEVTSSTSYDEALQVMMKWVKVK